MTTAVMKMFIIAPADSTRKEILKKSILLIEQSKLAASLSSRCFGELGGRYFGEAGLLIWLDLDWEICKVRCLM